MKEAFSEAFQTFTGLFFFNFLLCLLEKYKGRVPFFSKFKAFVFLFVSVKFMRLPPAEVTSDPTS